MIDLYIGKFKPQVIFGLLIGIGVFFINVPTNGFVESIGWSFLFGTLAWGIGILMTVLRDSINEE